MSRIRSWYILLSMRLADMLIGAPMETSNGNILSGLICAGPFHFPVPFIQKAYRAPLIPIINPVRLMSVCLVDTSPGLATYDSWTKVETVQPVLIKAPVYADQKKYVVDR